MLCRQIKLGLLKELKIFHHLYNQMSLLLLHKYLLDLLLHLLVLHKQLLIYLKLLSCLNIMQVKKCYLLVLHLNH